MSTVRIKLPELHDKQAQIKREYARFNVLNAGRRFGKNVLEHDFAVTGILNGWPVGWGSPTYKNLTEDWRTLTSILAPLNMLEGVFAKNTYWWPVEVNDQVGWMNEGVLAPAP